MTSRPIQLAVLVSGGGTTLQNLIDQIASKKLNAQINVVIASRPALAAEQRSAGSALPYKIIDRTNYKDTSTFSAAVFDEIDNSGADLICLAGWLSLLEVPVRYEHRVMNIHPALLP